MKQGRLLIIVFDNGIIYISTWCGGYDAVKVYDKSKEENKIDEVYMHQNKKENKKNGEY